MAKLKSVTIAKANTYTDNYIVKVGGKEKKGIYGSKSDMSGVAKATKKVQARLVKDEMKKGKTKAEAITIANKYVK